VVEHVKFEVRFLPDFCPGLLLVGYQPTYSTGENLSGICPRLLSFGYRLYDPNGTHLPGVASAQAAGKGLSCIEGRQVTLSACRLEPCIPLLMFCLCFGADCW